MHKKTTKFIARLLGLTAIAVFCWGVWYGVNKLVAHEMDLMAHIEIGDVETVKYIYRWDPGCLERRYEVKDWRPWYGWSILAFDPIARNPINPSPEPVPYDRRVTPLQQAVETSQTEVAGFLLSCGADPDIPRQVSKIKGLIVYGGDTTHEVYGKELRGIEAIRPLHVAAFLGNAEMTTILLAFGADPDLPAIELTGETPLHTALRNGHEDVALTLMEGSVNVHAMTLEFDNPLKMAMWRRLPRAVKRLCERGARPDQYSYDSNDPQCLLAWALACYEHRYGFDLLISAGIDPSAGGESGHNALETAARRGNLRAVRILLAEGAKPTPHLLHYAVSGCHPEMVRAALKLGYKVNAKAENGMTVMQIAAIQGTCEIVDILVAAGADVNALTRGKQTPWDLSLMNIHHQNVPARIAYHGGKARKYRWHSLAPNKEPKEEPKEEFDGLIIEIN